MANWSDVSQDVLVSIANLVVLVEDFLAFSQVCKAWRLAAPKENFTGGLKHQVPLLLLYPRDDNVAANSVGEFYNLRNRTIHTLSLAEAKRNEVKYSCLGWLITVSIDFEVSLLHPLHHHHPIVKLPNFKIYKRYGDEDYRIFALEKRMSICRRLCYHRALRRHHRPPDYVVMAIYNLGRLAFCRPGDDGWTIVDETNVNHTDTYHDVTYYKGQFYIVDSCGRVLVCNIEDPEQARIRVIIGQEVPLKHRHRLMNYFLVDSRGVLLAVQYYIPKATGSYDDTELFRVFEIPFSHGKWSDSEVTDLGSRTLFLGSSSSFSIEASSESRCKKNCISFTKNTSPKKSLRERNFCHYGTFTMAEKIIINTSLLHSPHLWIQPSF